MQTSQALESIDAASGSVTSSSGSLETGHEVILCSHNSLAVHRQDRQYMSAITAGGSNGYRGALKLESSEILHGLMQQTPTEIKEKLLKAVDKEYNVLDMGTVVEVIAILERTPITKEVLESTRLGKYINELRRKTTNENLAKRAKELVRQWRHLIVQHENAVTNSISQSSTHNHVRNGINLTARLTGTLSPGLLSHGSVSPGLPPKHSSSPPFTNSSVANAHIPVVSPAVSVASSEKSSSPCMQIQQSSSLARHNVKKPSVCPSTPAVTHNSHHWTQQPESPTQTHVNQVFDSESVPKTNPANKRLRKDHSTEVSRKKLEHPNGVFINNCVIENSRPNIEVNEDCSRDSSGGISDHGSVNWDNCAPPTNEVPQDNGLNVNVKNKTQGRRKRVVSRGAKARKLHGEFSGSGTSAVDDIVKEKIASIARIPKVKTTQELLAGLQAKTVPSEELVSVNSLPTENKASLANCILPSSKSRCPADVSEVSRNKTEHIAKFLRSQSECSLTESQGEQSASELQRNSKVRVSRTSHENKTVNCIDVPRISRDIQSCTDSYDNYEPSVSSKDVNSASPEDAEKTINDILARLPPVDYNAIQQKEPEDTLNKTLSTEETEELAHRLYTENVEGVSGNDSHEPNGVIFREWHETVIRPSYEGEPLHILPYVVID